MTSAHADPRTNRCLSRRVALRDSVAALAVACAPLTFAPRTTVAQDEPSVITAEDAFPPEQQLALMTIVETSLAQTHTPGALVGVWYPGRGVWTHAAGIGDLLTATPTRTSDHVRIASITKTFVATVILQLVDDGALGLDDDLESHIPGVPNGSEITIRQVLGMTAGIYDFVGDPVIAVDYDADPLLPFTPVDALAIIRASTPDFPPGRQVQYSNSNYILLGMIVEQLTGQAVETAIAERIARPLGMTTTTFATGPEMPEPYMHGYADEVSGARLRDVTRSNPGIPWASGAIISTLADLRIWAKALADGTLLTPETQQERLTFGPIETEPLSVGYGLGILEINGLLGHNGGILGYSSWMVHAVEEDATVVVVTNHGGNEGGAADPIFIQLVSLLFPGRFAPSAATPVAATPVP